MRVNDDANGQSNHSSGLARVVGSTKYIIGLAVLGIFVGSTILLISSAIQMFTSVWDALGGKEGYGEMQLRVDLIEAVDTVLVATVLYVIAAGLYQLFINSDLVLPRWLHTSGLADLERRLGGMVATVLSVIFVTVALESPGHDEILNFGLAIAAVIVAVSVFLFVEGRHKDDDGFSEG